MRSEEFVKTITIRSALKGPEIRNLRDTGSLRSPFNDDHRMPEPRGWMPSTSAPSRIHRRCRVMRGLRRLRRLPRYDEMAGGVWPRRVEPAHSQHRAAFMAMDLCAFTHFRGSIWASSTAARVVTGFSKTRALEKWGHDGSWPMPTAVLLRNRDFRIRGRCHRCGRNPDGLRGNTNCRFPEQVNQGSVARRR